MMNCELCKTFFVASMQGGGLKFILAKQNYDSERIRCAQFGFGRFPIGLRVGLSNSNKKHLPALLIWFNLNRKELKRAPVSGKRD